MDNKIEFTRAEQIMYNVIMNQLLKMEKTKPTYQHGSLTLEMLEKAIAEMYEKNPPQFPHKLPIGRIGNTNRFRIADNVETGPGGWEMFCKAMEETVKKETNGEQ